MGFLNEYKKLDNLCKDLLHSSTGVTTYIQNLESLRNSHKYEDDYKKLKTYRHIRNQIVHENNIEEDDLCDSSDIRWIQNFYRRILKQSDPLALENKRSHKRKATKANSNYTYKLRKAISLTLIGIAVVLALLVILFLVSMAK